MKILISILIFLTFLLNKIHAIDVNVIPAKIIKGETVLIIVKPEKNKIINQIDGKYINQQLKFIKTDTTFYAYMGIPLKVDHGIYTLKINVIYGNNEKENFSKRYSIEKRKIKNENFVISDKKMNMYSREVINNEEKKLDRVLGTTVSVNPLWKNKFVLPLKGEISSPFAAFRNINNGKLKFFHNGVDIGAMRLADIKASNDGIVCKAEELIVRGKTVIIDHGAGIFTMYNHMEEINVKIGDNVKTDDIIGKVGETGMATGTHLHWQFFIYGISVNPYTWVEEEYLYY
ncbi:M23 family metallopeptidase [Candidatus Poribacteria bacterium]|nr:M23 family metallopeptidase [Candidatus Poribacteria bacterium]